jgi:RNA polymerase sigma-70 factor (ECF subfamily)
MYFDDGRSRGRRTSLNPTDAQSRFDALVWPHAATVLRTARFLCHDQAEADDVAQDTLVKAFRSLDTFRAGTDVKAWLMTILRNTRIDRLRSRAAHKGEVSLDTMPFEPASDEDRHTSSDGHPAWDDPQSLLQQFSDPHMIQALQRLPEEIRWTLLLVDVEGMDHADAATVLGVPVGTVKSRAHRGRAMLRGALLPMAKELRLIRE